MNEMMRRILYSFHVKNKGDWQGIIADLRSHVSPAMGCMPTHDSPKFFSVMDDDYPNELEAAPWPPFILLYNGDPNLLNGAVAHLGFAGGNIFVGDALDKPGIWVVDDVSAVKPNESQIAVGLGDFITNKDEAKAHLQLALATRVIYDKGKLTKVQKTLIAEFKAYEKEGKAKTKFSTFNPGALN